MRWEALKAPPPQIQSLATASLLRCSVAARPPRCGPCRSCLINLQHPAASGPAQPIPVLACRQPSPSHSPVGAAVSTIQPIPVQCIRSHTHSQSQNHSHRHLMKLSYPPRDTDRHSHSLLSLPVVRHDASPRNLLWNEVLLHPVFQCRDFTSPFQKSQIRFGKHSFFSHSGDVISRYNRRIMDLLITCCMPPASDFRHGASYSFVIQQLVFQMPSFIMRTLYSQSSTYPYL